MMAPLSDHVGVRAPFARSANLERDSGRAEPFDGYLVTGRTLDMVQRLTDAALAGEAGGAWSVTGPYGSGKSSLALLLDAAFGPESPVRNMALDRIAEASPAAAEAVRKAHRHHRTGQTGFQRGLVTASGEPIARTLLRALHAAVLGTYGRIPSARAFPVSRLLKEALRDARAPEFRHHGAGFSTVVEIARSLAERTPLLLIVDEFGKSLEAIRDGGDADPYVLQQLAEAGQAGGLPIFLVTLQHLSFHDYLFQADASKRREWAKVQGRFEDVSYVESASQTRSLIGSVFDIRDATLRRRIRSRARRYADELGRLGIADGADAEGIASCYPLHPLVAVVLPELCSRYGQHERTLFSFLAGADRASAASFLQAQKLPERGPLPSVGLEAVYDYFVGGPAISNLALSQSSRWQQIATRLRDIHGLSPRQMRLAKSIALLNLVSTGGAIRASREVLALAMPEADEDLAALEAGGVITYRAFADEYRIWQGTDMDLRRQLDAAHERLRRRSLTDILSGMEPPPPVVAARHSAQNHVLRVFARRFVDGGELVEPLEPSSPYDGEVLLAIGPEVPVLPAYGPGAKPTIAASPKSVTELDRAAREVAAIEAVLHDPEVGRDAVAHAELGERLALARAELDRVFSATFRPESCRWTMRGKAPGERELTPGRGSAALSEAADLAYPSAPVVRNEMLNRTELTTQGARARRFLLEAMIERGAEPGLGLEGYGPEVAMYRSFLQGTGLHRSVSEAEPPEFRAPSDESVKPAWQLVRRAFRNARTQRVNVRDLYGALQSPPIGMRAGVIPVFLTAALLARRDDVAIYEHGTFKPLLTPDLVERLVRNPAHFEIKHFASTRGARRQVVAALARCLGAERGSRRYRVATVVAVVGRLVSTARRLDRFTLRTSDLGEDALAVRNVLVAAVEPDRLLFEALPAALGFPPVGANARDYTNAEAYARAVAAALGELSGRPNRLLAELFALLLESSAETSRQAVSVQAASLEGQVLDPDTRAFVLTLANDAAESDHDWIRAIATVVARKAPSEWADEDVVRFRRELPLRVAAFQRLAALHADGVEADALRVILTRPDGSEHVRWVGMDENERSEAEDALDTAVARLAKVIGSSQRAHRVLLALLGERLLPVPPRAASPSPRNPRTATDA